MTEAARAHTPTDTGAVAASWRKLETVPVSRGASTGWESGTEDPHWRARWVEYGVAAHEITPKRARALGLPEGARANANHPGYPGAHPAAKAAADVEAALPAIAQPHLSRWAEEIEQRAKRHPGVS